MRPIDLPLDKWPDGWLKLECCSILNEPLFLILTDTEKRNKKYPVNRGEMIELIQQSRLKETFTE